MLNLLAAMLESFGQQGYEIFRTNGEDEGVSKETAMIDLEEISSGFMARIKEDFIDRGYSPELASHAAMVAMVVSTVAVVQVVSDAGDED